MNSLPDRIWRRAGLQDMTPADVDFRGGGRPASRGDPSGEMRPRVEY